jgi:hypothetical protein
LEINKPNPVPELEFVANFVNNRWKISGDIPRPVSLIVIIAFP